ELDVVDGTEAVERCRLDLVVARELDQAADQLIASVQNDDVAEGCRSCLHGPSLGYGKKLRHDRATRRARQSALRRPAWNAGRRSGVAIARRASRSHFAGAGACPDFKTRASPMPRGQGPDVPGLVASLMDPSQKGS